MKKQKPVGILSLFIALGAAAAVIYRFGTQWLRLILLYFSGAHWARKLVSSLPLSRRVASRFVAGEDIAAALAAADVLNQQGMRVTLDYLGENVTSIQDSYDARDQIAALFDAIHLKGVDANVSVKLSQLGLKINQDLVRDNVRHILLRAKANDNKVRIDMEESAVTESTLQVYRTLRDELGFGHRVGIVIQSYLHRSDADVKQLVTEGAWVRLCKGAYAEPPEIAFADKADTDASFVHLMQLMLSEQARQNGVYLGVATHDDKMVEATISFAKEHDIPPDAFEFQMLYGIRRDLQQSLVADGYQVRVYVPFGTAWYPYFVRRLAEHPANLWFFISNLWRR